MRLALLTLILGLVLGILAQPFVATFFERAAARLIPEAPEPIVRKSTPSPRKPFTPIPVEKILARFERLFDEAVVVVLANESYDDRHKLIVVEVLEVWKGPADLVGKTMNSRISPPISYLHSKGSVQVLKFMPMTPFLTTSTTQKFTDDALVINPAVTVEVLRAALTNRQTRD